MALSDFDNEMKTIWAARTLAAFDTKAVFAALTNQDFSGEAGIGKTVIINTIGDITLLDYGLAITNGAMTSSDFSIVSQSMPIDQWKYFNKRYDNLSQLWGNADTFTKLVNRGADAFALNVDQYIASLHSGFTYSASVGGYTGHPTGAYDAIVDMGTALLNNGVPVQSGECFVVVSPEIAGALVKDPRFTEHLTYLQNGLIDGGLINNMKVYVSANSPASGSTGHWAIAGHPEGWALAKAVEQTRLIENPDMFGSLFQSQLVYGAKIVNQKALYKSGIAIT